MATMSRFAEPPHAIFRRLNDSISFDWRLGPYDVEQSRAHAAMLAAQGIISEQDRDQLLRGLEQIQAELSDGSFPFADGDEDIHMAIERRLTEIVGRVGGKMHTARSRNDQVATDMAMFTRAHAHEAQTRITQLGRTIVELAAAHVDWPMPGYTHLQRAQPVYLSHHLLAYAWMLVRDRERFQAVSAATQKLPLGAGALAGVNFDTDRSGVAALISPASAPRSCSGRPTSSASAKSRMRGPRAPRSCRRRRTPMRPSCSAPRLRGSRRTWSASTASSMDCR
jgi:argininosuccinate lyase